jgi:hypothetical protein
MYLFCLFLPHVPVASLQVPAYSVPCTMSVAVLADSSLFGFCSEGTPCCPCKCRLTHCHPLVFFNDTNLSCFSYACLWRYWIDTYLTCLFTRVSWYLRHTYLTSFVTYVASSFKRYRFNLSFHKCPFLSLLIIRIWLFNYYNVLGYFVNTDKINTSVTNLLTTNADPGLQNQVLRC